jgi:DNA-binding beta-propeller fold protein YncE
MKLSLVNLIFILLFLACSNNAAALEALKKKRGMTSNPMLTEKKIKPPSFTKGSKPPSLKKKKKKRTIKAPSLSKEGSKSSKSPKSPIFMKGKSKSSKSPRLAKSKSKSPRSQTKPSKTFTLDKDFDEGSLVNINHDDPQKDQLQLNTAGKAINYIWIALSGRGTIAKVDTLTGTVLGEYNSAPDGRGKNPSRTTVDLNGNVWAGNRDEADGDKGSMVHVGLLENAQCVDRNGDGIITTSTGLGDVKPWTNAGGADNDGGVSTAVDECIIHYTRTVGTGTRTLTIDKNNDLWAGGRNYEHEKINGSTGEAVPGTQFNLGCGGYGGLIDKSGILWSATYPDVDPGLLLRVDTNNLGASQCLDYGQGYVYGLGIDTNGFIWNTDSKTAVRKIASDGSLVGTFETGGPGFNRGVAVTPADNNVWVANSNGNTVSRLDNNGNILASINVGDTPTGVAVDAAGKVWVTNGSSDNAMRINPATNLVDLTVFLGDGSDPYNYSDMTGSTLSAPPKSGTWTVTYDSGVVGMDWVKVRLEWNAYTPSDSSVTVEAQSSADNGATWSGFISVTKGVNISGVPPGKSLQIRVSFRRATTGESPVLYDLTVSTMG